ncbi:carboxypeptidase regulatory-like domain-containing protein [Chitinophaga pendula]|uniref:TonB-dependent receptor n=1 Tax=Chitinophaga TaxID=79328 RepID=UPI000BAF42B3|nr:MULTISPECIES: TonB-dependent receptor [Chitinophaga]ASZ12010.1 cell envelope biogenesis protein OmpA [Chitinophaga sp. MD30]UCJ04961.1 carboxypeptidase regulatory-like domain-containing protein [Chitinophaga pendula]
MGFRKLLLTLTFLMSVIVSFAQVTTSSMTGTIKDEKGEGLIGATVKATHLPSGTVYGTATQNKGSFAIQGMRVGGPYKVEISYIGYETKVLENISLLLGDAYVVNQKLGESGQTLNEVRIVGGKSPILNSERTGASTNVNSRQLSSLPTISRSITDFTRLTPQANGTNFAGRDGRFNSVKIDGAVLNNGFGLDQDLLPGGKAQPISLDAIEEVQVNVAPYDVRQTGFTGAGINAVTRSGTNDFSGSVYGLYRNENFNGSKVAGIKLPPAAKSSNKIFGARLGGAIIKNKLFFFANYEKEENIFPGNTWVASRPGLTGPNVARTTADDLEAVRAKLIKDYGYDPGRYENYANEYKNKNEKFLVRLDWNINDKNKFTVRYNQMEGTEPQLTNASSGPNTRSGTGRISNNSISFENANYSDKHKIKSLTAELNSIITPKFSNQFLATYSRIQKKREAPGSIFPFVDIWDGNATTAGINNYMSFGTELFSFNNEVINNNFSFIDNVTYLTGKHTITAGLSFETQSFGNSYMREGTSYYRFNSVQDFLNNGKPSSFAITYPYAGADIMAKVKFGMAGAYIQDKITVNDQLNVTVGLRVDLPLFLNDALRNPTVDTLQLLGKNGQPTTFRSDKWPNSKPLFSPRIGVNYDVFGDRSLQIRGGTGIFTGLIPFVWFTNMPTNSGVIQNTLEPVNAATLAQITNFNPDPYYWVKQLPNSFPSGPSTKAPGTVALVDPNFKMPQIWRTNLGVDYKIPSTPLVATLDVIYSKDINAVYQYNANRKAATQKLQNGSDTRDFWNGSANAKYNNATGDVVPVLSNTNKGNSLAASFGLSVPSYHGFSGNVNYTYTRAKDITGNPGSAANSAWSNNYSINDPNELLLGYSQFAVPHRVSGSASYRIEYGKHFATTVSVFYQGTSRGRFAYTYGGDINRDGVSLDLLYVPANSSEINFAALSVKDKAGNVLLAATPDEQRAAFDKFVNNSKQLKDARGGYVERNNGLLPWQHRFDVRVLQDLFTNFGSKRRHTLQLSVDILNFGNLLNSNWGVGKELNNGSFYQYSLLNVTNVSAQGVPTFNMATIVDPVSGKTIMPETPFRNWFDVRNLWSMQLGVRYIF